jgi:hypothetical protein
MISCRIALHVPCMHVFCLLQQALTFLLALHMRCVVLIESQTTFFCALILHMYAVNGKQNHLSHSLLLFHATIRYATTARTSEALIHR